LIIAFAIK
jgi:hypothetical protein